MLVNHYESDQLPFSTHGDMLNAQEIGLVLIGVCKQVFLVSLKHVIIIKTDSEDRRLTTFMNQYS
jgi:hypothetical protein